MNNYSISKDLITAIEDNNLVLFIGSGLSRNFGFPNWKELVMGLLNDLSFHDKKYESLKGVLDTGIFTEIAILDKIIEMNPNNKKKVYEFLESTINKDIQELDLSLLSILNQLSTKIITTNYDKLLEISNQTYKKLTYNDTFHLSKLNEYNEFIFKLHGDIGTPESCILFTSDYEELYETKHAAIERLKSQIADKTILFIGFSFNDIYVKETFAYINEVYKSLNRTHYIITTDDINYTEYGLESIKLESYDELANLIGVLGSYKKESNGLTDRKVTNELQIAPETSVNTTKNSAAILFSNPIDLDNEYNVDNITKYFKKYNLEIDIFHLTQDSLFDLENYEYLFIFTREIQGKLVIEDDYFKSKLITLKELDNQLSILAPRGIFLIVNKEIKREDSPINLIHSQNITLPFSLHLYEENLNSLLYNILRKADINKLSSKSIYNQDF
ncbi:SIR2 family protein, partial [Niallia circulans]|uniref:SIR2 family protein n=1 Tax=Niallia circulans TaxID=1397 RepID=UPI00156142E9